jgi:antitoxin VapB
MALPKTARIFINGRSQAVRLPAEFRFSGDRVRVSRQGKGVLLEPVVADVDAWFAALDQFGDEPFMAEGRAQPVAPRRRVFP